LTRVIEFADVEAAVRAVKNFLKPGDVVLLKASRSSRLERIAETLKAEKIEMLYFLSQWILDWAHGSDWEGRLSFLRLFRYITVRCAGAAITSLVLSWWLGPKIIRWLKELKFGQEYADKAEEAGLSNLRGNKKGTPTMGGLLIVVALVIFDDVVGAVERAGGADDAVGAGAWPAWDFTTTTRKF
jgi:hypothetical protein